MTSLSPDREPDHSRSPDRESGTGLSQKLPCTPLNPQPPKEVRATCQSGHLSTVADTAKTLDG